MSVKIRIPTVLRRYVENHAEVEVNGGRVEEVLADLVGRYPELRPHLFDERGQVRSFVNIYLNSENIRHLDEAGRTVTEHDEISIVPAVAGGTEETTTKANANASPESLPHGLSAEEMNRYSRHMIIPEVGVQGQTRLKQSSVLLIGAGGLGSPLALYLAAAGVGRMGIVDFDTVDYTNLQRQVIHTTGDVGRSKLESARETVSAVNPFVQIELHETRLTSANALEILGNYDVIIDGTDNFPTRYLVNDACVILGKPNVYGSIFRFEGQASVFDAKKGPCYRCLYPEPPPPGLVPSCAEGGVLGILPGIIGTIQANEAVKLILGLGESLIGRLLLFDALAMEFREVRLEKDPSCPVCGTNPTVRELIDYEQFCGLGEVEPPSAVPELSAKELAEQIDGVLLIDVREAHEREIASIPGSVHIPLHEFERRVAEIDPARDVVVHCRSGVRSARAAKILLDAGYKRVRNLAGGVLAWSEEVDPSVPKY